MVKVTLEGDYSSLRRFDADSIAAVILNLSGYEEGQVTFDPEGFRVPPGLTVREVRPAAMVVQFEARAAREVEVIAKLEGETEKGYRVTETKVTPATVRVEGAESIVRAITKVKTSAISMVGRNKSTALVVPLAAPPIHTAYDEKEKRVRVNVVIEEQRGSRVVGVSGIELRGADEDGSAFDIRPGKVDVTITGPVRALDALAGDAVKVYIDGKGLGEGNVHTLKINVEHPDGVDVTEIRPPEVTMVRKSVAGEGEADAGKDGEDGDAVDAGER
jgi:YbbR domain-containing protein